MSDVINNEYICEVTNYIQKNFLTKNQNVLLIPRKENNLGEVRLAILDDNEKLEIGHAVTDTPDLSLKYSLSSLTLFFSYKGEQPVVEVFNKELEYLSKALQQEITNKIYGRLVIGGAYLQLTGKLKWEDGSLNITDTKSVYFQNRMRLLEGLATSNLNPKIVAKVLANGIPLELLKELEADNLPPSWIIDISETFNKTEFLGKDESIFAQVAYGRKIN
jgi:hypothetical protein